MAQTAEQFIWKVTGSHGNSDRGSEHLEGFNNYDKLQNLLGNVLEVGAGPWTQTRMILHSHPDYNVKTFSILEPSSDYYRREIPSCAYKDGRLFKFKRSQGYFNFSINFIKTGGEGLLHHAKRYDTLVSMNVLEHVQNAYAFLEALHHVLKPGGTLVWHERWFDTESEGDGALGRNTLHPIRVKQIVLNIFLRQFDLLYCNMKPTSRMRKNKRTREHGFYVIGRKKNQNSSNKAESVPEMCLPR